jgi:hypothetical protein
MCTFLKSTMIKTSLLTAQIIIFSGWCVYARKANKYFDYDAGFGNISLALPYLSIAASFAYLWIFIVLLSVGAFLFSLQKAHRSHSIYFMLIGIVTPIMEYLFFVFT